MSVAVDALQNLEDQPSLIASKSLLYFGYHYFPHLCALPPSDFHYDVTDIYEETILVENADGERMAVAAPRGFAKTTWFIIFVIWCAVYNYRRFMIFIGSAASNAEDQLENIKDEIESNERLLEDFPNVCGEGPVWRANSIILRNGVRIDALGAGQKVRGRLYHGQRPDLIALDDVETDENVVTPDQRKKIERWFTRAVLKAGQPKTVYLLQGTVLHMESLLNKYLTQPGFKGIKFKAVLNWADRKDLWDKWAGIFHDLSLGVPEVRFVKAREFFEQNEKEMLKGTQVLWPERWDYYNLMVEYERDGPYAFSSERQNDPTEVDSLVTRDEIGWYDPHDIEPTTLEYIVGGVDPSLGKTISSDFSAILHVGLDGTGQMYLLNCSMSRRKPDDIINDALELTKMRVDPWPFPIRNDVFLVESVAFQEYFKTCLDKASQRIQAYLPTIEVKPRANKDVRIMGLQPHIKNHYIRFRNDGTQESLIQQLTGFPHTKKDGPDCLSMIVEYITAHSMVGNVVTVPSTVGYKYGAW